MPASFYEHEVKCALKGKRALSGFIDRLVMERDANIKKVSIKYIFCNDEYLLQMNEQFLQHDTLTDIITFDLTEKPGKLLGEIYISIDRVAENATKFKVSFEDELLRVIFHGALHLCGFKDKTAADAKTMRAQEDICLAAYKNETIQ